MAIKSGNYLTDSGDIIWLNFTPQIEYEQKGKRPSVVLSPIIFNEKTDLCIAVSIISKIKNYPFEVKLSANLKTKDIVLAD